MYYNLPLFSFNVQILKFVGIVEFNSIKKTAIFIVIKLITNICQIADLLFVWDNLSAFAISSFMAVVIFNSLVRVLILMRHQQKFIEFMKEIECWYKEIQLNDDAIAKNILKHLTYRTRAISNISFVVSAVGSTSALAFPLFLEQRAHPFPIYLKGLDIFKSPLYEIIYAVQCLIVMPFIVFTYVPFTNLFISLLLFGISLLKILRKKFETFPSGNNREQLKNLVVLIKYHQRIINYGQTLEMLFSFICLMEFLFFSMMLCILLLSFLVIDNIMNKITTFIYVLCVLYIIFISYWHANEFSSESLNLANAVYGIDWPLSSMEFRKCVIILLMRCQTPLKISPGNIFPMTLEAFQAILNAAYAYFNMFRGLMTK